jgi:xanthine dehydrogenase accessory factor
MLDIYRELIELISKGEQAALATVISSQGSAPRGAGAKMLIKKDHSVIGSVGGGGVEQQLVQKAIEVMDSGVAQAVHLDLSGKGEEPTMICGGQVDVFIEPIQPQETIYLFGAGHVSQSTAEMAKMLDFRVVVIDPRAEYNNIDRFPHADVLMVEDYADVFTKLDPDKNSYIVIYTPGHVSDEQCLHFAVGTSAKYVGMIGSKKKVKEVKERLLQKGVLPGQLEGVHAPIGLAIHAETPQEIAISILAEIVKVKRST